MEVGIVSAWPPNFCQHGKETETILDGSYGIVIVSLDSQAKNWTGCDSVLRL